MTTLFDIAVTNAVIVVPLAVLVWLVSRVARRPALTHALWIVVLLKLVTPPLFHLPVTFSIPTAVYSGTSDALTLVHSSSTSHQIAREATHITSSAELLGAGTRPATGGATNSVDPRPTNAAESTSPRQERGSFVRGLAHFTAMFSELAVVTMQSLSSHVELLASLWLLGVLVTLGVQGWRATRFARCQLASVTHDDELQRQTERLARQMGLRRCPEVRVIDATVSPMLWSCGSHTRLLFPQALLERLDAESRATLLMHELAHFGRGDHWVRWLELITTSLFWWHPVLWWARHEIEQSEEECCDAWVVAEIPQSPRRYAEAILNTIDFLCGEPLLVSPMASGLGNASVLRRRLTKIMCGVAPKTMSRRVRAAVALLMAFLLPLQPFVFGSASANSVTSTALLTELPPFVSAVESTGFKTPIWNGIEPSTQDVQPASDEDSRPPSDSNVESPSTTAKSRALRVEKVWSNAVSSDGRFVVRATTARRVLLNELSTGRETDLSSDGITAVSFAPDARQFVAVANDGRVMLWDATIGELKRVLYSHESGLRSVSVSPLGDSVAVGGHDGTLLVLDMETGEPLTQWPRQSLPVNCVRFSPDATRLAVALGEWSSSARGEVRLINLQSAASEILECDTAPGAITFVSNDELIVGQWNGHAALWNLIQHKVVGAANANKSIVAAASFSPDNPQMREIAFVSFGVSYE